MTDTIRELARTRQLLPNSLPLAVRKADSLHSALGNMCANQCFYLYTGSARHAVFMLFFRKELSDNLYLAECNTGSGWWRGGTLNYARKVVPHIYRLRNNPSQSTSLREIICWMMLGRLNPRYDESERGYPGHWLQRCRDTAERAERCGDLGLAAQSAANPFQRGGSCAVRSLIAAIRLMFALDCVPIDADFSVGRRLERWIRNQQ